MKVFQINALILSLFTVLAGCTNLSENSDAAPESLQVQYALESVFDGVFEGTAALSVISTSSERFIANNILPEEERLLDKMIRFLPGMQSLHATAFDIACQTGFNDHISTSGKVNVNPSFVNGDRIYSVKTYTDCSRKSDQYIVAGATQICHTSAADVNNPNVANTATHSRAPVGFSITRRSNGQKVETVGTGANLTCTGATPSPASPLSHVGTFSSVGGTFAAGFTASISQVHTLTKTGKNSAGSTLFTHAISGTATIATNAASSARTRTITGTITNSISTPVTSSVSVVFNDVVISMANCLPTSGSATFTFTGAYSGSGTVAFANNSATYTYTNSAQKSAAGTLNFPGCLNQ